MVDKLRAVVIGCGNMGTKRIKSLMESSEAQLVFIVDQNLKKAGRLANECEVGFGDDPFEAMDKVKPDFVVISTPNKFHAPLAIPALKRNIHVLCEKPLARNPQEAMAMVKAVIESQAFLKTGSNLRYFPSVMKAKELLDKHEIGNILFVRGWIGNNGWHLEKSWKTWFSDHDIAGGGTILDNGAHMFDLIRWFMGEVRECTGMISTVHWKIKPLEDVGFCIFKSIDDKVAFIQSSWVEWAGYMYMEIYGSDGYIRINNRENVCATVLGLKDGSKQIFDYSLLPSVSYKLELEDFISSIRHGQQPLPSGYDGFRAVQMAFGVYKSALEGRSVVIYGEEEERLKLYESKIRVII